ADRLEKLAYNSLPGTTTADMWAHQYDQQSNQVLVSEAKRNWSTNGDFSNIYGLMPNFACCLANMHQGWPKFISSMWMATNDNGLALVSYGPSVVEAFAGKGTRVRIEEITDYPFGNKVTLVITTAKKTGFPLELRIPGWADSTIVKVRNKNFVYYGGELCRLDEKWENGDSVQIEFPMTLRAEKRYNGSVSVLRGPLVFSLRIEKKFSPAKMNYENPGYLGSTDWEIMPESSWNYGLIIGKDNLLGSMEVKLNPVGKYPFADKGDPVWSPDSLKYLLSGQEPPVVITARGIKIPEWTLRDNSADVPPLSPVSPGGDPEKITLVPYGSARLRITEFPVMDIVMMEDLKE
ncbi:MAG: glycoside hydrolase family 127 protein, partial [Bacteroidales bacterium]|nr:glycoside hydrolase family 127 protein [Bacteroidales bacterium]